MKLTGMEMGWAEAALVGVFPGSAASGFASIGSMDVRGFLAGALQRIPLRAALGIRLAIWIVALAPVVVLGRLRTIARLAQADRERVLARLVASDSYAIRSLVLMLKTFGALLYAGNDAIRQRIEIPATTANILPIRVKRVRAA
jgi:hypothetical protein